MRVTYQATGRHAMLEEDNKDGSKVFYYVWYYLLPYLSDQKFIFWCGKD